MASHHSKPPAGLTTHVTYAGLVVLASAASDATIGCERELSAKTDRHTETVVLAAEPSSEGPPGHNPSPPSASAVSQAARSVEAEPAAMVTVGADAGPGAASPSRCRQQRPLEFLLEAQADSFERTAEGAARRTKIHAEAIAYRTKHYGYFKGYGSSSDNAHSPSALSQRTSFFDIPLTLNRAIIPALKCVETEILSVCQAFPYRPRILSGLRYKNTYVDLRVSNHVYGIAVDIDPQQNPCCNCIEPWRSSPLCQGEKTVWARMSMPRCWVEAFERYGFYWLGHDKLEDTMHFEFLGDPDKILIE